MPPPILISPHMQLQNYVITLLASNETFSFFSVIYRINVKLVNNAYHIVADTSKAGLWTTQTKSTDCAASVGCDRLVPNFANQEGEKLSLIHISSFCHNLYVLCLNL